ncbi:MAG TPA: AmmeMemoRadiSam system radical SAM enzyme, partial [candidate division Zixibacteria bacterium]|nr:AmmeMemoRadiSam system radical SAM enzyme [candidate division Zixibacteria bacterium]
HLCHVGEGLYGVCGVRKNNNGRLDTLIYDLAAAINVDPIEKKPLFHFLPGSQSLSVATVGCNFKCPFCQNYDISQVSKGKNRSIVGRHVTPSEVIALARQSKARSVAFTYSEPTIFYEYAYDTACLAHAEGIHGVFVSNGFICEKPLQQLRPYVQAFNVDLKGFDPNYYRRELGARLEPVLDAIRLIHALGFWLEITTLIIPGRNDSDDELTRIAEFIAGIDPDIPWHLTAFHPDYKMNDRPRTPVEIMRRARAIGGKAGLRFVYTNNLPGDNGESTYCPQCDVRLIHRIGFQVLFNRLSGGACPDCGTPVPGVWS